MSDERISGGCVAVRSFTHSSSFSKCTLSHSSIPDYAACGTTAWRGKNLTCVCFKRKGSQTRICLNLTPLQEERLKRLRHRTKVQFDASRIEHQEALRALWSATYPGVELQSLKSDQWKEMGWQGNDPSTDFRGAGFISLENLLFFAKTFSSLLRKQTGKRAMWEYPFAVAGVNITFMILQMLDLDAIKPRTPIRAVFLQMLSGEPTSYHHRLHRTFLMESTNNLVFCRERVGFRPPILRGFHGYGQAVAGQTRDIHGIQCKQNLLTGLVAISFRTVPHNGLKQDILRSTRSQLEREFVMDDVLLIEDMPSYNLLR
ncbi:hypothetical protein SASPL_142579 [Salvia splendens]|uniref:ELMO domain-containing protein n=1 Tax=Salvia splendens TaxID=180675 RepID=A0A8X8WLY4_SALSN|nr:hypothetical protein SASPL_142579 [Salvia splendens]